MHLRGMFLHGAEQLELGTGTLKVVTRPFDFEVGIAQQKIGEEAQSELVGDHLGSLGEVFHFHGVEQIAHSAKIPLDESGETIGQEMNFGEDRKSVV